MSPGRCPCRLLVLGFLLAAASPALAQRVYVDAAATGARNGSSWADAYTELSQALRAGGFSEAWVAEGTYEPAVVPNVDPRRATFELAREVALYGGFAGHETALHERDPAAHPTILSGDIGVPGVDDDNAYHVVTLRAPSARIDGFVVTKGRATGPPFQGQGWESGGGLFVAPGSAAARVPIVVGCTFVDNAASDRGGAVQSSYGRGRFLDCTFTGNAAGREGGAVSLAGNPGPDTTFLDCTFTGNTSASTGGALHYTFADVSPLIDVLLLEGCTFEGNQAEVSGGALDLQVVVATGRIVVKSCRMTGNGSGERGGALFASPDNLTTFELVVCDTTFTGNVADTHGGAIYFGSGLLRLARSRFAGNEAEGAGGALCLRSTGGTSTGVFPFVTDSEFIGNRARRGGAVASLGHGEQHFVNCTFAGNAASLQGGGHYLAESFGAPLVGPTVRLENSIVWGNSDGGGADESAQVHVAQGSVLLHASLLQGLSTFSGLLNIDGDPLFVDLDGTDDVLGTDDDDVRLQPGSPCIDRGNPFKLLPDAPDVDGDGDVDEPQPLDRGGLVRRHDDPATPDGGVGPAPVVDIGAHEFGSHVPPGPWVDLGGGSPGAAGVPLLAATGSLQAGQPLSFDLSQAPAHAPTAWWFAVQSTPLPALGGTVVAVPPLLELLLPADGRGGVSLALACPEGLPPGLQLFVQCIVADGSTVHGATLSNAVRGTVP